MQDIITMWSYNTVLLLLLTCSALNLQSLRTEFCQVSSVSTFLDLSAALI